MAMSRYLTPPKISLLVLVNLYCDSVLAASATIPVLSFILSHLIPPISSNSRLHPALQNGSTNLHIQEFEEVLLGHTSNMPGRTVLDVFLRRMWEVNSFDALHDLFSSLGDLLMRTREEAERDDSSGVTRSYDQILLSRTSPFGVFVRRAKLEFTRLQFDDAMELWADFIRYRAPTAKWSRRIAETALTGVDIVMADLGITASDSVFSVAYGHLTNENSGHISSIDDIDRMLEFQLDRLQRLECRVPEEMVKQLRAVLVSSGGVLRQSHLLKFFDAWKAGDYTSAFDNLHRYYDYAMQTREKIHYQYALLHMAILQADFGCFDEAITAITETIMTARENQDMACLNFSLSWLNHMSKAYPHQMRKAGYMGLLGSERDAHLFLKSKAKETKMISLLSATLLNEAKFLLSTGESIPRAFEYMYQASHLNVREFSSNFGGYLLLQSALYSRLGIHHLSGVHCELVLHCYGAKSPADESIKALCRCAVLTAEGGDYDTALDMLATMNPYSRRSLKINHYIYYCAGIIKLKRAMRENDWAAYGRLFLSLEPDPATDPELSLILSGTHIDSLIRRNRHSEAFSHIQRIAGELKEGSADIVDRLSILLLKAILFARVGKSDRCFSIALRAASISFKARLMPTLWYAIGLLCNTLNALGEYGPASRLLDAVIPQSLEHSDLTLCALLYTFQADSFVGMAGTYALGTSMGPRNRAVKVSSAEFYIGRACECFKRVRDIDGECEQLYKKAIIAQLRGDEQLAEEWAQNYGRTLRAGVEKNGHT